MKVVKKDYPFTVITEDKISKAGKMYKQISIGFTSVKDKNAQNVTDRYHTTWINFIDSTDLLKLSTICEHTYQQMKNENQ